MRRYLIFFFFKSFPFLIFELQDYLLNGHLNFTPNPWQGLCATCNQSDLSKELTEDIPPRLGGGIVCCLSLPNSFEAGTLSILSSAISPVPRTVVLHRRCSYIQIDSLTVTPSLQNIPLVSWWKMRFYSIDNSLCQDSIDPMNDFIIYIYIFYSEF